MASGTYDVQMTYNDSDGTNVPNPQTDTDIVLASISCTTTVSASGNLQPAIDASSDGDTICVEEATYSENITFSDPKNITVIATGAVASTIIQGGAFNTPVVTFSNAAIDSTTVLEGVTVDNSQSGGNEGNGGVRITSGAAPTIKNSTIKGNDLLPWSTSGAGIYINGGGATIDNCIIGDSVSPNKAKFGAGIYILNSAFDITITDTIIKNNTTGTSGELGGGIYHTGSGTLTIDGGSVESNYAHKGGGGI